MQDMSGECDIIRPAISVSNELFNMILQQALLVSPPYDEHKICEPKITTSGNIFRYKGKSKYPVFTANNI